MKQVSICYLNNWSLDSCQWQILWDLSDARLNLNSPESDSVFEEENVGERLPSHVNIESDDFSASPTEMKK